MRIVVAMLAAVVLVLAFGMPASAQRTEPPGLDIELHLGTSLFTPPLITTDFFLCWAVNVSPTPLLVSVRLLDASGDEVRTKMCGLLDPKAVCLASNGASFVPGAPDPLVTAIQYCRITAVGGADAVRGALQTGQSAVEAR